MRCHKLGMKEIDYGNLIDMLLSIEGLPKISIDIIPLLFDQKESQWDNLSKCIALCPEG